MDLRLYVITDRVLSGRSHEAQAEAAIAGGATAIQLRDKAAPARELVEVGRRLGALCRGQGVLFIVNDRADVAVACEADGVHVGEDDLPVPAARRLLGPGRIVGASAGTLEAAVRAEAEGADYLGVGSVFATGTKADAGEAIGVDALARIVRAVRVPVVGIGGITVENAAQVVRAGAAGVAVISAVVAQPDIAAAARALRAQVDAARAHR
ncbi:MAG: thiamine phosphate synthase [Armatimonadota bacterium]|nr:thiamine phosphate synthase [Armatimonadota bacterium]MDR7532718.1 thiamine phosphate synthase [Armatimonadota bacterium]MDR7535338.1 thiamine phosphate synthase [Armatimonadota bacterium]